MHANDQIRHLSYLVDVNHVFDGEVSNCKHVPIPTTVTSQGVEIQGDFIKDVGPLAINSVAGTNMGT
jgi:hypothetical protein